MQCVVSLQLLLQLGFAIPLMIRGSPPGLKNCKACLSVGLPGSNMQTHYIQHTQNTVACCNCGECLERADNCAFSCAQHAGGIARSQRGGQGHSGVPG